MYKRQHIHTPIKSGIEGKLIGGRWLTETLALQPSPAEQLRQLRSLAEKYQTLPTPGTAPNDASTTEEGIQTRADIGLAFDSQAFISNLTKQLSSVNNPNYALAEVNIEAKVLV